MFLAFCKVKTLEQCRLNASANKARKPQNRLRIKGDGLKQRTQIVRAEIQANKPLWIKCLFSFLCIFVERHFIGEFSFFRQEQNVFVFFFIFSFSRSHNQCYSYVSVCEIGSDIESKTDGHILSPRPDNFDERVNRKCQSQMQLSRQNI